MGGVASLSASLSLPRRISLLVVTIKNVSRDCQMSPAEQNCPWLRMTESRNAAIHQHEVPPLGFPGIFGIYVKELEVFRVKFLIHLNKPT